jgi:hypothetical protein
MTVLCGLVLYKEHYKLLVIFQNKTISCPLLNEIDAGKCEGMTYKEIEADLPEV